MRRTEWPTNRITVFLFRKGVTLKIDVMDASNYFKGLLLLIRKDGKTSEAEINLVKHVGKSLGFEKEFCSNAISDILENRYIVDEPPRFSSKELAAKFIKDGLSIAFADNDLDRREELWLQHTAEQNGIDFRSIAHDVEIAGNTSAYPVRLEVDDLIPDSA
jgi:hypothetical protein